MKGMRYAFAIVGIVGMAGNSNSQQTQDQAVAKARLIHQILNPKFKFEELERMSKLGRTGMVYMFMKQDRKNQYFEDIHVYENMISSTVSGGSGGSTSRPSNVSSKKLSSLAWSLNDRFRAIRPGAKFTESYSAKTGRYDVHETPYGYPINGNRNEVSVTVDPRTGKPRAISVTTGYRALPPPSKLLGLDRLIQKARQANPELTSGRYEYSVRKAADGNGLPGRICQLYYAGYTKLGERVLLDPVNGNVVYDEARVRRERAAGGSRK